MPTRTYSIYVEETRKLTQRDKTQKDQLNCSQRERIRTHVFIPHCHVFIKLSIKVVSKTGSRGTVYLQLRCFNVAPIQNLFFECSNDYK